MSDSRKSVIRMPINGSRRPNPAKVARLDVTPGRFWKNQKMPGHMGQVRRTAQNLEVIQVRTDDNVLLIKGSCPGSEGDYIIVRTAKKKKHWPRISVP